MTQDAFNKTTAWPFLHCSPDLPPALLLSVCVIVCQQRPRSAGQQIIKMVQLGGKGQEVFHLRPSPSPCFSFARPLHFPAAGTNTYCPWKLFLSNPEHLGNEALNKYRSVRVQ